MILGFTGHRDCIVDPKRLVSAVNRFRSELWVHGGAEGFDTQVEELARDLGIPTEVIRPDYVAHPHRGAPNIRNAEIVRRADLMIAAWDGRRDGGTMDAMEKAVRAGRALIVLPAQKVAKRKGAGGGENALRNLRLPRT